MQIAVEFLPPLEAVWSTPSIPKLLCRLQQGHMRQRVWDRGTAHLGSMRELLSWPLWVKIPQLSTSLGSMQVMHYPHLT